MRRRQRLRVSLATLAVVAALTIATAAPASAAPPVVTVSSPGAGELFTSPSVRIAGEVHLQDLNRITGRITGVVVTISGPGTSRSCDDCWNASTPYDATFGFTPQLDFNGPYSIRVVATGTDVITGTETAEARRSFKVEVPPAPPRDVRVEPGPDRRVTISWARNSEPDVKGYRVNRLAPGSSTPQVVGSVDQPSSGSRVSLVDAGVPAAAGTYRYTVTAIRPDRDGVVSNRATAGSSPVTIELGAAPSAGGGPPGTDGEGPGSGPGAGTGTGPAPSLAGRPTGSGGVSSLLSGAGGSPPSIAVPGGLALPVDGGFSESLPFAVPDGEIAGDDQESDDPAVLENSSSDEDNQRALFVPIAAGLLLCVLALHMRQFNRTVLGPPRPAAYLPILEQGDDEQADDEPPGRRSEGEPGRETAVLVGAGRPGREG